VAHALAHLLEGERPLGGALVRRVTGERDRARWCDAATRVRPGAAVVDREGKRGNERHERTNFTARAVGVLIAVQSEVIGAALDATRRLAVTLIVVVGDDVLNVL
jgi:hypothetical protein